MKKSEVIENARFDDFVNWLNRYGGDQGMTFSQETKVTEWEDETDLTSEIKMELFKDGKLVYNYVQDQKYCKIAASQLGLDWEWIRKMRKKSHLLLALDRFRAKLIVDLMSKI